MGLNKSALHGLCTERSVRERSRLAWIIIYVDVVLLMGNSCTSSGQSECGFAPPERRREWWIATRIHTHTHGRWSSLSSEFISIITAAERTRWVIQVQICFSYFKAFRNTLNVINCSKYCLMAMRARYLSAHILCDWVVRVCAVWCVRKIASSAPQADCIAINEV